MSRIGIMGGTFNPIHNAHLAMAHTAYKQAQLQEIWFMPSKHPPHKQKLEIVSEQHRSAMIQAAIQPVPYFVYSDFELCREGITYTAETLLRLKKDYPENTFFFLMGGDSFFQLEQWYHPEIIMENADLLVASRGGAGDRQLQERAGYLRQHYGARILLLDMRELPISSSRIRENIRKQRPVTGMLPEAVEAYIKKQHLYEAEA